MLTDDFFTIAKDNFLCNTSYPLDKYNWNEYKTTNNVDIFNNEHDFNFYIHIPFCEKLCTFCEYIKYPKNGIEKEKEYLRILKRDIYKFIEEHSPIQLYGFDIGGGTPTVLYDDIFSELMDFCKSIIDSISKVKDMEPSIEATFNTITEKKAKKIFKAGFRRISLGIQTRNSSFLKKSNRADLEDSSIIEKCKMLKDVGIEKINIDLMYGLEKQTYDDIKETLKLIEMINPEQVTLYEIRYNLLNKKIDINREHLYNQYLFFYDNLIKMGYYARLGQNTFSKNKQDFGLSSYLRYRMIDNVSYKGFGIAAQSKSKIGISYNVGKNRKKLDDCLNFNSFGEEDTYLLPKEELLAKYIAISMYYGMFKISVMQDILKADPLDVYGTEFEFLKNNKYIEMKGDNVFLTETGFKFYGAIGALFYSNKVKKWLLDKNNV